MTYVLECPVHGPVVWQIWEPLYDEPVICHMVIHGAICGQRLATHVGSA